MSTFTESHMNVLWTHSARCLVFPLSLGKLLSTISHHISVSSPCCSRNGAFLMCLRNPSLPDLMDLEAAVPVLWHYPHYMFAISKLWFLQERKWRHDIVLVYNHNLQSEMSQCVVAQREINNIVSSLFCSVCMPAMGSRKIFFQVLF